jgi:hypothetical protein
LEPSAVIFSINHEEHEENAIEFKSYQHVPKIIFSMEQKTRSLSENGLFAVVRHSREGGNPGNMRISGFPPSRE